MHNLSMALKNLKNNFSFYEISAEYSFLLTYFPQKHIIISEMGNHRQESSCQIVGNFIFRRVPAR